mgnify:FL=1
MEKYYPSLATNEEIFARYFNNYNVFFFEYNCEGKLNIKKTDLRKMIIKR